MKILMVSIFAPHFFNWTEQLRDSGHEVYWLDVFDSNTTVERIDFVHQIIGWRYRFDYRGRYFIKQRFPKLNRLINKVNERSLPNFFEKILMEIKPDVVQSFVLQEGGYPILKIMKKHSKIPWIFSAWGNDLYYGQQLSKLINDIKNTLPEFDYMFSDCLRDHQVAKSHGFKGKYLGAFPGGGGYELNKYNKYIIPFELRNVILLKGYQSRLGRCNKILEALIEHKLYFNEYNIVVFGGNKYVKRFIDESGLSSWKNLVLLEHIPKNEVLELMGKSLVYIGNSISDGMPNTLLEAIIMGAFPIQSNPGGATAEIIENNKNGLLIENPEDVDEIRGLIFSAINDRDRLRRGIEYNNEHVRPKLERNIVKELVLEQYRIVEEEVKKV
ncbi:MAG: glycosyltransferase family 4 protein [Gillisia sp.]